VTEITMRSSGKGDAAPSAGSFTTSPWQFRLGVR
jgi:hypothetical protein